MPNPEKKSAREVLEEIFLSGDEPFDAEYIIPRISEALSQLKQSVAGLSVGEIATSLIVAIQNARTKQKFLKSPYLSFINRENVEYLAQAIHSAQQAVIEQLFR